MPSTRRYGEIFPEPAAVFSEAPVVKGTDGANKMSKSLGNVIEIFADEDVIRQQIMSMVTDTQRSGAATPAARRSATSASCTASSAQATTRPSGRASARARTGCVDTKKLLVERILSTFAEARERYRELRARPGVRGGSAAGRRGDARARGPPRPWPSATSAWGSAPR